MARIRKYMLTWYASESKNVTGYKVYWSEGNDVGYDSTYIEISNFTQLPDLNEIIAWDKPVMFGVTAVDFDGNESDMVKLPKPFQVNVPKPPFGLFLEISDQFKILPPKEAKPKMIKKT